MYFILADVSSIDEFLLSSGRQRLTVEGDGNCLFRSLALQLTGSDNDHDAVRTLVARFENLNKEKFACLISSDKETIQYHIKKLLRPNTWGTHVELAAIATYLQVHVYYCIYKKGYKWERITALGPPNEFRYPYIVESDPIYHMRSISHFELHYIKEHHYEPVISCVSARVPIDPPPLSGSSDNCCTITID